MATTKAGCDAEGWAGIWVGATAGSLLFGPAAFVVVGTVSLVGMTVTQAFCDGPYA